MRNKTNRARLKYKKIFCGGNLFNKIYGYIMVLRLQIYDLRDASRAFHDKKKQVCMRIYRVTRMKKGPLLNNRVYFISFSK